MCVSPLGTPTGGAVCRHCLKTHPQQFIHQWELLETCDENDQLLTLTGFSKNMVYTSFTYISPFILDTKNSTLPLQFCDCLWAYYKGSFQSQNIIYTQPLQLLQQLYVTPHKCCCLTVLQAQQPQIRKNIHQIQVHLQSLRITWIECYCYAIIHQLLYYSTTILRFTWNPFQSW